MTRPSPLPTKTATDEPEVTARKMEGDLPGMHATLLAALVRLIATDMARSGYPIVAAYVREAARRLDETEAANRKSEAATEVVS